MEALEAMMEVPESNPRGIPSATFLADIEKELEGRDTDEVLKKLQENYQNYKLLEQKLMQQKVALKSKLPDIERTLEVVQHLKEKHEASETVTTRFELADSVFAKAEIKDTNTVCLWLGANVMLEYSYDEAVELLEKNKANAEYSQTTLQEDLMFLRDQITITEVTIARIYNHDVRKQKG